MREPCSFFNFQMTYSKYEELKAINKQNGWSIAEIVRQTINLLLNKLNNSRRSNTND
jgi:hypothetical protein